MHGGTPVGRNKGTGADWKIQQNKSTQVILVLCRAKAFANDAIT
jgi:hypothetical protein